MITNQTAIIKCIALNLLTSCPYRRISEQKFSASDNRKMVRLKKSNKSNKIVYIVKLQFLFWLR